MALDDEEIVRRLRRRDSSGVEALLQKHGPFVKAALRKSVRYVRDEDQLESALNDGAMIMWKKGVAKRLDPKRSLRAFYYVTCRHELTRIWKNDAGEKILDPDVVDALSAAPEPSTKPSGGPTLDEILSGLSPLERAIVMADMASNFRASSAEIAELLKTTPASVDSLKHRIRKKLRRWVDGDEGGSEA